MILQASVEQLRDQTVTRARGYIVIAMCYHPRGVKREWRDDFRNILAPDRDLFTEWKTFEKQNGHDKAFELSHYEERFTLSPIALGLLKLYSQWSHEKDIFLVCQCEVGERCHREMLLLLSREKYGAKISKVFHSYTKF